MSPEAFRRHLRDLRKRRGAFRAAAAAEAEAARLLARLAPGSIERKAFELTEILQTPFKKAADQLGVSERHLYRIRSGLLERLAADDSRVSVHHVIAPELQQLELARTLIRYGHAERGEAIANRLLSKALPAEQAVDALTTRALALSDRERYSDARAALEDARVQAARLENGPAQNARRAIAMTEAYIPYRDGFSDAAIDLSEAALRDEFASKDPFEARRYARDLIFLAVQHEEANNPVRGLECLARAHELLGRLAVPPSAELAQIFLYRALLHAAIPDRAANALADAEEALRIAQWHGLRYEEVWSHLALACLHDMAGKPKDALPLVHRAVELGLSMLEGDPLIRTLFITARVEGACGLGDAALQRLQTARPLAHNHGLLRGILEVAEARARRQRGEVNETIAASTRAIDTLEGRAKTHYLGIPYLARAIACAKSGADSRDDVERALFYLDRGGALGDKARAFELSFEVTRNRKHLDAARELRRAAGHIA